MNEKQRFDIAPIKQRTLAVSTSGTPQDESALFSGAGFQ
jgi:hypothetical protein